MSQISRRNFMKCAGAAALAIAASGILTGCDNTLDVEVTFVYNGQTLPLRGTGKVVTGEQYMDTATIVLPAEYQEQYKVRAEKVKVIRENGTRKAVVELVVKTAVWTVSYRLGEKEVLSGSVEAAAGEPHRHGEGPEQGRAERAGREVLPAPEGCQGHRQQRRCDRSGGKDHGHCRHRVPQMEQLQSRSCEQRRCDELWQI